jgi:predicted acylesterase/phospholipase RssA
VQNGLSFQNLVFEGGVKGIAYVGAMKVLEKEGILKNIKRVGGTSAGSINAVLFAAGFTNQETLNVLNDLNFKRRLVYQAYTIDKYMMLRIKEGIPAGTVGIRKK